MNGDLSSDSAQQVLLDGRAVCWPPEGNTLRHMDVEHASFRRDGCHRDEGRLADKEAIWRLPDVDYRYRRWLTAP